MCVPVAGVLDHRGRHRVTRSRQRAQRGVGVVDVHDKQVRQRVRVGLDEPLTQCVAPRGAVDAVHEVVRGQRPQRQPQLIPLGRRRHARNPTPCKVGKEPSQMFRRALLRLFGPHSASDQLLLPVLCPLGCLLKSASSSVLRSLLRLLWFEPAWAA